MLSQSFAELTSKEINTICKKKDYNYLITELNKLKERSPENSKVRWYMPQNRETIPGYFEQVFEVVNDVRVERHLTVHTFKISFIRKGTKILYYSINGYKKNRSRPSLYNQKLHSKKRFFKLRKHNKIYKLTYQKKLDFTKLFNLDNTYGYKCGSTEAKTYLTDSIEILIDKTTLFTSTLLQMLKDENVEIQLYAYYGFHRLIKKGYKPDFVEQKFLTLLENKKGSVAYCDVTQNKQVKIAEVIQEIKILTL